jgi:WD40 repeat protein
VLAPLGGAGSRFNAARFGGRGRVVVAGCADGTVGVYCARTGRPRAALLLGGFGGGGGGSSGLGDGGSGSDRPASAARRQSLFPPPPFPLSPWAQQRLLRQRQRQRAEHAAAVWCVDAGDELAASGGVDSQARVWSLRTGATLLRLRHVAGGGDDGEAVTSVRVLERASAVLTSHARGLVALWDVRVGAPPVRLLHLSGAPGTRYARTLPDLRAQMLRPTACYCAQVDGDGDGEGGGVGGGGAAGGVTVVAGGQGGRLHLFDLRQGAKVARVDGAHEGDVLSMHLSAGRVVTGAKDGSLKLWDLSRLRALGGGGGQVLAGGSALVLPTPRGSGVSSPNRAHAAYIASRAPSPAPSDADDGNGSGGTHGCPCVALSYEHDADVFSCRLAGGGDWRVASASEDGTVKIWDAEAAAAAGGGGGPGGVGCGGVGRAGARRRRRQRRAAWRAYGLAAGGDDSDGDEGEGEDDDDDDGRCCREWRSLATLRPAADGDPRLLSLMLPPPPLPPLPLATAQLAALGLGGGGGNGAAAMAPGAGAAAGALPPLPAVLPMQRGPGVHCVDICDDRMVVGGNDALLRIYAFGSAAEEDEEDEDEDDDEG